MVEVVLDVFSYETLCCHQLFHLVEIELGEFVDELRLFLISNIFIILAMVRKLLKHVEYQRSNIIHDIFSIVIYK